MGVVGRKGPQVQVLPPDIPRGHEPLIGVKVQLFNRRMRKRREASNMSQADLAEQCGINKTTISEIELLKRAPSFEQMNVIASALCDEPEHMFPEQMRSLKVSPKIVPEFYLAVDGIRLVSAIDPERDLEALERLIAAREVIKPLLDLLTPRERYAIDMSFGLDDGSPATLESIGREMLVSAERVRQLLEQALEKLRRHAEGTDIDALLSEAG